MSSFSPTRRQVLLSGALALVTGAARSHDGTVHVSIDKLVFSPAEVTVKPGATIEWTNNDAFVHTATVKGGWEVMIPPGKKATRIVQASDSVEYYCRFHPNMKGRIVVSPA
ncbi:cupredoxin domain-containing protein [Mesorhizobium sp. LHD-90]|uniref:cupredoxin domain-containing protein n=1 Tax=Mesorhizobium sp. LHD-90 TaxID=3071414 RepID=UPI0027DFD9BA|nr:cupredoxin domain-containing protein [Mesorhizobium sp. LHD-90]MDQ6438211.1 cupredoxin domain-containing protein [Mesorhizobium sp. LHD-90]